MSTMDDRTTQKPRREPIKLLIVVDAFVLAVAVTIVVVWTLVRKPNSKVSFPQFALKQLSDGPIGEGQGQGNGSVRIRTTNSPVSLDFLCRGSGDMTVAIGQATGTVQCTATMQEFGVGFGSAPGSAVVITATKHTDWKLLATSGN